MTTRLRGVEIHEELQKKNLVQETSITTSVRRNKNHANVDKKSHAHVETGVDSEISITTKVSGVEILGQLLERDLTQFRFAHNCADTSLAKRFIRRTCACQRTRPWKIGEGQPLASESSCPPRWSRGMPSWTCSATKLQAAQMFNNLSNNPRMQDQMGTMISDGIL